MESTCSFKKSFPWLPGRRAMLFITGIGCLALLAGSCHKSHESRTAMLIAKWNLVSDTSRSNIGSGTTVTRIYTGGSADYWDFRNDGKVYTKEGDLLDTLRYQFYSDNLIGIESFGWGINGAGSASMITTLTLSEAVIHTNTTFRSPAGNFYRVVHLKK